MGLFGKLEDDLWLMMWGRSVVERISQKLMVLQIKKYNITMADRTKNDNSVLCVKPSRDLNTVSDVRSHGASNVDKNVCNDYNMGLGKHFCYLRLNSKCIQIHKQSWYN